MADKAENSNLEADSEAKKWFMLAVVGTILYVSTVFAFVINGDLGDEAGHENGQETQTQEADHGQPH